MEAAPPSWKPDGRSDVVHDSARLWPPSRKPDARSDGAPEAGWLKAPADDWPPAV